MKKVATMRKIVLLVLLVLAVGLEGCNAKTNEAGTELVETSVIETSETVQTQKDERAIIPETTLEPQHVCDNVCATCGLCLKSTCRENACKEKCAGHLKLCS